MRFDARQYKDVWKSLGWLLLAILASRLTKGAAIAVIALAGLLAMGKNRPGLTILCYMLMPLLVIVNISLRGEGALFGYLSRLCPIAMTMLVVLQAMKRTGRHSIPLGFLYVYLVVATVSSISGWCPLVSYLKVLNFLVFLVGIHLGTMNLHHYYGDLRLLRNGFLAFSVFIIFGSIITILFPSIGYSMFITGMSQWVEIYDAKAFIENFQGLKLFSGVTNHSQCLSPMVVSCAAWCLLDMLYIERRFSWLHISLICSSPILLYMTRSRMGFVGFAFAMMLVYVWVIPKARVGVVVKRQMQRMFTALALVAILAMIVVQARDQTMSKWLRKTNAVESDQRDMAESVTVTRLGLINENLRDFQRNPMWGMGFQTSEQHKYLYQMGRISLFSAPIEKGVLPLMILGETGAVGVFVFLIFLFSFYATCIRKSYVCTTALMSVYLVLNLADASFFSPGGLGSSLWIVLVCGGFTIDMIAVVEARQMRMCPIPIERQFRF